MAVLAAGGCAAAPGPARPGTRVKALKGGRVSTSFSRDGAGALAMIESAEQDEDFRLRKYTLYQKQLGRAGSIAVDGDTVRFLLITGDEESRDEETVSDPVVSGPTLFGHIYRNWDALMGGAEPTVRFAVLERLETIGFTLRKDASAPGQVSIRMAAASPIIALGVDPIFITFDATTKRLVRLRGRVPPKVEVNGELEAFDARVEYRVSVPVYR